MTDRAKYLLHSIDGLNWLAIIPLLLFFALFVAILVVTYKNKASFNDYAANLPLEESDEILD